MICDRVGRMATLRLARVVPVRNIEVAPDDLTGFEIVSDYVPGNRLSDILAAAGAGRVVVSTDAALHIVRQVLGALAALHQSRAVTHGAMAPERLIVTPKGHVVIADCVFGLAIERLNYSRARLWNDFQIPTPPGTDVPQFDQQADVVQVGFIAMAMLSGRPYDASEDSGRCSSLLDSLRLIEEGSARAPIPKALRVWLSAVLRIEKASGFATARDAQLALADALATRRWPASAENPIKALVETYERAQAGALGDPELITDRVAAKPAEPWQDRPIAVTPLHVPQVPRYVAETVPANEPVFQPVAAPIRRPQEPAARRIHDTGKPASVVVSRRAGRRSPGPTRRLTWMLISSMWRGPAWIVRAHLRFLRAFGRAIGAVAGLSLDVLAGMARGTTRIARGAARTADGAGAAVVNGLAWLMGGPAWVLRGITFVLRGVLRLPRAIGRAIGAIGGTALDGIKKVARATARVARGTARAADGAGAALVHGLAWLMGGPAWVLRGVTRAVRGIGWVPRAFGRVVGAAGGSMLGGLVHSARGTARMARGTARIVRALARAASAVGAATVHGLAWLMSSVVRMLRGLAWVPRASSGAAGAAGGIALNGLAQGAGQTARLARAAGPGFVIVARAAGHVARVAGGAPLKLAARVFGSGSVFHRNPRYPLVRPQFLFGALLAIMVWSGVQLAGAPWRGMLQPLISRVESATGKTGRTQVSVVAVPGEGALRVESQPSGAQVWLDGRLSGETPLVLDRVKQGSHAIVIRHASGSVRTVVRVQEGETAELLVPIYSGWLAVFARAELQILEAGVVVGTTDAGRILVRPGSHSLELVNTRLGFRTARTVEVKPGEVALLNIELPPAPLEIVAPAGAEIWVDGRLVGSAPLESQSVAVGTLEVVMRHPTIGERRQTTTVAYGTPNRIVFPSQ